jgi:hypothetical protein
MYELKKVRDPVMQLFMEVDIRIETAQEHIIQYKNIPKTDIKKLIKDKETLQQICKKPNEMNHNKIWSANNLIYKINYILEINEND